MSKVGLVEVLGGIPTSVAEANALYGEGAAVTLVFRVSVDSDEGLEALRNARRSLLREEWTRGRDVHEPSLEDAVFSAKEIVWAIRPDQRPAALAQLEELRRRADLLLSERERHPEAAQASGSAPALIH